MCPWRTVSLASSTHSPGESWNHKTRRQERGLLQNWEKGTGSCEGGEREPPVTESGPDTPYIWDTNMQVICHVGNGGDSLPVTLRLNY